MTAAKKPSDAFVFMKVGNHAGETFAEILARKRREYETTGRIFWGYGGLSCHPLRQVQPFARLQVKEQGSVYIVMQPIDSRAEPEIVPATEYSEDGIDWRPLPKGISVTGSRYALILDEIRPEDLAIDLGQYVVAVGPSRGKAAPEYLQGHVDKACLIRGDPRASAEKVVLAGDTRFVAKSREPYAVLVR